MSEDAIQSARAEPAMPLSPLAVKNLTPRIGAEITADRAALLRGAYRDELRELLEQRGVLIVRDIHVTADEQLAFAQTMGEVLRQGAKAEDVFSITLEESEQPRAFDYLYATICWHFDGAPEDLPNRGAVLSPVKLSDSGGNTEFANTYAAYADLPAEEKRALDKLRVLHRQETLQRHAHPHPTAEQLAIWRAMGEKVHPLVWTHRSGRKSLVLGLTATRVEGMDPHEGRALLEQAWATQREYVYVHQWRMGDILIWDNTGVIHRVQPYPRDSGRRLQRCTLAGEEPLA